MMIISPVPDLSASYNARFCFQFLPHFQPDNLGDHKKEQEKDFCRWEGHSLFFGRSLEVLLTFGNTDSVPVAIHMVWLFEFTCTARRTLHYTIYVLRCLESLRT